MERATDIFGASISSIHNPVELEFKEDSRELTSLN
jgi:hypothetical protein